MEANWVAFGISVKCHGHIPSRAGEDDLDDHKHLMPFSWIFKNALQIELN